MLPNGVAGIRTQIPAIQQVGELNESDKISSYFMIGYSIQDIENPNSR